MLQLINRATLPAYLFDFIVWILYNNVLSNLVHNIPLFPKYRFELRLAAYVCKVTDPAAAIWPFIGFALLKFVSLMVILFY